MDINEKLQLGAIKDGPNVVTTKDGKVTFTFHSQGGNVTDITAAGSDGKPLAVTFSRGEGAQAGIRCTACIEHPGGKDCYDIDCSALPKPKGTAPEPKK